MNDTWRRVNTLLCLLIILLVPVPVRAQLLFPDGGFVFDDSSVPRIDISMAETDLESLYADPESNEEYKVQFTFTRGAAVEALSDVGIRFRGNTSRGKAKKSFRLSFNTFVSGRDFHGIEKMNLNAETNDPSLVRSKLSWEMFRRLGVPGARSNHVLLYINDDFHGVYVNTEHIDEKFVRSRFSTNDGNLYKCLWPADLVYLGPEQDDYKSEQGERRAYELKINEEWDDYGDLAGLISVLHQYSGTQLMEELERVLNVQQYLKTMAVDVMTGNWDGYIANMNNYYLYRDPVTGRFEYIAYDLDNTWGIDWLGEDWSDRSIYNWHRGERPLYEKILQQESYREQYTGYIKALAEIMTSDALAQEVARWRSQISGWVSQDPYYPLDWGYEYSDFEDALNSGSADHEHLWYGVLEYASLRAASALGECIQADAPPLISHARVIPSPGIVRVDWSVEDDAGGFSTMLHYRIDEGEWQVVAQPEPAVTDPVSGVSSYRDSIAGLSGNARVDLYFTAADNGRQETRYPAQPVSVAFPLVTGPLLINEFMASNSGSVHDEYGEADDWVEFYNPTAAPVRTGDLYLSDDMGVPGKYRFPDQMISPGGFMVIWLDGQPEQGNRHAPFRISRTGEVIRLSNRPAEGFSIMDSLTFGPQETDLAMGRAVDGGMEWIVFSQPTPGFSNLSTGLEEYLAHLEPLLLYPNPVTTGTLHFSRSSSGTIYNMTGKPVLRVAFSDRADVGSLGSGLYIFHPVDGVPVRFVVAGD
jgi:spore coat protein H